MKLRKFSIWYWSAVLLLAGAWLIGAYLVVPKLIEDAYNQESLAFLNEIISGRGQHSLGSYLEHWAGLARRVNWALAIGSVLLYAVVVYRGHLKRWAGLLVFGRTEVPTTRSMVLLTALALGLIAGLGEAAWVWAKNWNAPNWEAYTSDVTWMAPLGSAAVFVVLALALLAVTEPWLRLRNLRIVGFVFSALMVYAFARSLQVGVHPWAGSILAVGIGVNAARFASRHPSRWSAIVRRATPWLASLILVLALGGQGLEWLRARNARAGLVDTSTGRRNVLLIILDTVRGQNLSVYGYARETTPNLDRRAADAVIFDRALATSPWTLPSHASLFTGRFHHEVTGDWLTPFEDDKPTLAGYLASHGYESGAFVGNYYYCGRRSGLNQGFTYFDDDPVTLSAVVSNSWLARSIVYYFRQRNGNQQVLARRTAGTLNRHFLDWLDGRDERPFFAFINYYDGHGPYLPPAPFNTRFADPQPLYFTWPRREFTEKELDELVAAYDGSIAYMDHEIGRLLEALDERGVLKNTLVIVSSDHGEQFAEARPGLVQHGNSLYMTNLQVPLLILDPDLRSRGGRVAPEVSIRDIPATIVDLLGIEAPHPFPGSSLRRYWSADVEVDGQGHPGVLAEVTQPPYWTRWDPVAVGPMKSILKGRYHYIVNGDGTEELYDIGIDPWERQDLSPLAESDSLLDQFRSALSVLLNDSSGVLARR